MATRRLNLHLRQPVLLASVAIAGATTLALAGPASAQSYAVVQSVPPPAAGELSDALRRLARSPADFDALIAAGRASLALDDIDAAIGFFGRADVVRGGDPRVKAGLATAYLKTDRPIEALQMFTQAQDAGAAPVSLAADRGLAFDLVGDNASAQAQYRLALTQGANAEVSRRLGLSQAISGDRKGFEATLLPLLQRRDFAAFRVRAFGLAILGDEQEAVSIAEAVMPRDLSGRITPYLRYMAKLTRPQQAAAANLGAFPRAAQIGREDPRFAQYAGPARVNPGGADARLAPSGQPLGPRKPETAPKLSKRAAAAAERQREREAAQRAKQQRQAAAQPVARSVAPTVAQPPVVIARAELPAVAPAPVQVSLPQVQPVPATATPPIVITPVQQQPQPTIVAQPVVTPPPSPPPAVAATALVVAEPALPSTPVTAVVGPAIDLPTVNPTPATVGVPVIAAAPPEPQSLRDAFADFNLADVKAAPAAGAVDITAIKPKREVVEPKVAAAKAAPAKVTPAKATPPPPSPKPKVPSRVWVQVATGKDPQALAFDWRRYAKKAPQLLGKREPFTAKWGETRRLLAGPFDSPKAAAKMVADLKAAGIDSFTFTSEAGEDVAALK